MAKINAKIDEMRSLIEKDIAAYNAALSKEDLAKAVVAEQELKQHEKTYAELKWAEVSEKLSKETNPIEAAIRQLDYEIIGHKTVREEGVITGFEIVDDKRAQIDLVRLCETCKLPTEWRYKVEKFNQLLALRAADEIKAPAETKVRIKDSFYMNKLAKDIKMGETPLSNTQICKQLQVVLDAILFVDDGKGKNVHHALNRDVAYLLMCYTKPSKKALTITIAKNGFVHKLVMQIMHRIVCNKVYDVDFKIKDKKEKDHSDVKVVEPAKAEKKVTKSKKSTTKKVVPVEEIAVEKVA